MDDFINEMASKTGISKEQAEKVIAFLKEHSGEAMKFISSSGVTDKLPGGLGGMFGGQKKD